MNYYDFLKKIRGAKSRADFIKTNDDLNNDGDFQKLRTNEQFCIKAELYERFKMAGYKDSKNFSFLIAVKPSK